MSTGTHRESPYRSAAPDLLGPARGEPPAAFEARVEGAGATRTTPYRAGRGRLVWRRWGEPCAPVLVLLHGGFGSWRHFALNVLPLARSHCVHAPDLPGLGDSDPLPVAYTAPSIAAAVCDGIDSLLLPEVRVHLCGFSFGGIIAGLVAARLGDRAASYTGVAPGGLGLPHQPFPALVSPRPSMDARAMAEVHRANLGRLMIHDPDRVDELAVHLQGETVRRARARSGDIPSSDVLARALERLAPATAVHAVWGTEDVIVGPYLDERRALFARHAPARSFRTVAGAGHWVMYERPREFESVLLDLIGPAQAD